MALNGFRLLIAVALIAALCPAAFAGDDIMLGSKIQSMKKAGVGPVKFPHTFHKKKFKCSICHPGIFADKLGANDISMKKNMDGKFCGSANCHNSQKAFPLYECAKCHTNVKVSK